MIKSKSINVWEGSPADAPRIKTKLSWDLAKTSSNSVSDPLVLSMGFYINNDVTH